MDGQLVLLEISQQDGAWPRSQLQSMLEAEEEEAQAQSSVSCFVDDPTTGEFIGC